MVEIPVMVTNAVINIQEDKTGEAMEVAEGALNMTANQTTDLTVVLSMEMVVDVIAAGL